MIVPSKKARLWQIVAGAILVLCAGAYAGHLQRVDTPSGGTLLGLALGVLAVVLILVLTYFGRRKRSYHSTFGTLEGWLQAHLYLGLLTVPVVLLHAGFRFHDRLAVAAFAVMLLVVLSGVAGAVLYTSLPRRLTSLHSDETPEEISDRLNQLGRSMARLAEGKSTAFRGIYRKLEEEGKPGKGAAWRLVVLGAGEKPGSGELDPERFDALLRLVDEGERDALRRLLVLGRQRRELHRRLRFRRRYEGLLQLWLYAHVPLTAVLLALVAVHVVAALWFRGVTL